MLLTALLLLSNLLLSSPTVAVAAEQLTSNTATTSTTLPDGSWRFVIPLNGTGTASVTKSLIDQKLVVGKNSFSRLPLKPFFEAGAYKLYATMTPAQILGVLNRPPYMKWVVIPEGLRKEEIADLLAKILGWPPTERAKFLRATQLTWNYREGVYFPDTYLIPVTEKPSDVANRLTTKFNEKFKPYLPQFNAQNIRWTTGITLASIIQREAANKADMPLIAGILWNRLDQRMKLDVDATLQYARGDEGKGYWAPITVADKKSYSPYNTYRYAGLPPHAISNPGLSAIDAVLRPATTTCLYYLHDSKRVTHCANTYPEHLANIKKYLIATSTATTTRLVK